MSRPLFFGRTRGAIGAIAAAVVLTSVAVAQVPPVPAWSCTSGPGQNYEKAGRALDALGFGITPALLAELTTAGLGFNPNTWVLDQLNNGGGIEFNPDLAAALAEISLPQAQGDPNATIDGLGHEQLARALFSRWQLFEKLVYFWELHLTTDLNEVKNGIGGLTETAVFLERQENIRFRDKAFGPYGEILLASATSPTMLIYLDNDKNIAAAPNENYARELMELFCFGLPEGGTGQGLTVPYTAEDIADVAKVFTGWTVKSVNPGDEDDPHAEVVDGDDITAYLFLGDVNVDGIINSLDVDVLEIAKANFDAGADVDARKDIARYHPVTGVLEGVPDGVNGQADIDWCINHFNEPRRHVLAFHFDWTKHDFTQGDTGPNTPWTLFAGHPELEVTLPAAGTVREDGILKGLALLDHLANVARTRINISTKLYNFFISDEPPPASTLAAMDAKWTGSGGEIRTVLRTILGPNDLFDPATHWSKAKTPLEYVVSVPRALGASLPPTAIEPIDDMLTYLRNRFGYRPFQYPSPEGFPNAGGDQVSTGRSLSAVQYNQHTWDTDPAYLPVRFDYDFSTLLTQNTTDPRDPQLVLEYLVRLLFQCNWSQVEHDVAWQFLNTDSADNPIVLGNLPDYEQHVAKFVAFLTSNVQFALQ